MSDWIDAGFVAFDTETTGLDVREARIVTAAAVTFRGGEPVESRAWLIRVDVPIPEAASSVHGITDDVSQRDGQDQAQALEQMRDFLESDGLPVVCFNSGYDIPLLDANLVRQGLRPLSADAVLCPWIIDKQLNRYVRGRAQRRLKPTAERYGLTLSEDDWHGAEADALVTGRILLAQAAAYPQVRQTPPAELARLVDDWRREQEADYQAWKARQP